MKGLWIFPAITSLFVVILVLGKNHWFAVLCMVVWLIRLLCLKSRKVLLYSFSIGVACLFHVHLQMQRQETLLKEGSYDVEIAVKQTSFQMDGDRIQFYGQIDSEEVVVRYFLLNEEEQSSWMEQPIPEEVLVKGELVSPSSSRNPDQFDYQHYLNRRNVYWILDAEELQPTRMNNNGTRSFSYQVDAWRQNVLEQIDHRLNGVSADYIKAILFADRRGLSKEVTEQFRSIGIIHLLSISGLHIQFLIYGLRRVLLRLGITRESTSGLLLVSLPLYGTVAGWGISVFRAIIQSCFGLFFQKMGKPLGRVDYWALTMILSLFLWPFAIYSIGFQLSYLLSGLLLLMNQSDIKSSHSKFKEGLLFSLFISLISIPVLTYHFYEFPWISLFANALFVPMFTLVVLPVLILLYILSIPFSRFTSFQVLIEGANLILKGVEALVRFTESQPFSSFVTGRLSLLALILFFIGFWLVIHSKERTKRRFFYLSFGVLFCVTSVLSKRYSPVGQVMMIDVGQGESILIKEPFGQGIRLIDTGGQVLWQEREDWQQREAPFSLGKDVVVPVLKSQGVHEIDTIYLSHADTDHIGALPEIIEELPTTKVMSTESSLQVNTLQDMFEQLARYHVKVESIQAPQKVDENLYALYPLDVGEGGNNDSLVLYGKIGEYMWLFTGDLEEAGERELVQRYPSLNVDILNVGHHGSNTSTHHPLLEQIEAERAWISSGVKNIYGHPHPDVLDRLSQHSVTIYRTDQQGAIRYYYSSWPIINNLLNKKMIPHIEE